MTTPTAILKPVSFRLRSPYSFNNPSSGLPPAGGNAGVGVTLDAQGNPSVEGMQLQPLQNTGPASNAAPVSTFDSGKYGDASIIVANFTGAGLPVDANGNPLLFVLTRPNNTRTMLLFVNQTVLGNVYYQWDKQADNVNSIAIGAGGSRNYAGEGVPQGNLSLYASGAGTVLIEFMNSRVSV